ncbi:MAG: hypothetical protein GY772_17650, partial [bacterium]|nr:hypothetical protein [bacterium]
MDTDALRLVAERGRGIIAHWATGGSGRALPLFVAPALAGEWEFSEQEGRTEVENGPVNGIEAPEATDTDERASASAAAGHRTDGDSDSDAAVAGDPRGDGPRLRERSRSRGRERGGRGGGGLLA